MEKLRRDAKQAEREERKRDIESQKEQLRLRAEREVARHEVEKLTEQHSRMIPEYQQSVERVMAYCGEREALRRAEEDKLRWVAEQEGRERELEQKLSST